MSDIELVIKIDEDIYKSRKRKVNNSKRMVDEIELAIANGTPLPKGHGILIDANELDNDLKERQKSYEHTFGVRQPINEAIKDGIIIARTHINHASTIIDADRSEEV